jgi:hypothetical protein
VRDLGAPRLRTALQRARSVRFVPMAPCPGPPRHRVPDHNHVNLAANKLRN